MATRSMPFWPRPATTSGSSWLGSELCASSSGSLFCSSRTEAAPHQHPSEHLNGLFHRRLATCWGRIGTWLCRGSPHLAFIRPRSFVTVCSRTSRARAALYRSPSALLTRDFDAHLQPVSTQAGQPPRLRCSRGLYHSDLH